MNVFLPEDMKSIAQTHIFSTMQLDNRLVYNGIESWITGLQTILHSIIRY